jgi:uncharacterized protein
MPATNLFAVLNNHQFINLTTFRKSGKGVMTPVWFAEAEGSVYIVTAPSTGKAKRIRNNPHILIAPGTISGKPLGPDLEAQARLLPPEASVVAHQALQRKYGWQLRLHDFVQKLRQTENLYIECRPA